jgi:hypothetical protein
MYIFSKHSKFFQLCHSSRIFFIQFMYGWTILSSGICIKCVPLNVTHSTNNQLINTKLKYWSKRTVQNITTRIDKGKPFRSTRVHPLC